MIEQLDIFWQAKLTGWWVQPLWIMVCAFAFLHGLLRAIHTAVAWPCDRRYRLMWVVVAALGFAYFTGNITFAHEPSRITGGTLLRNVMHLILVVWLMIDAVIGIKGTVSRRLRRHSEQNKTQSLRGES